MRWLGRLIQKAGSPCGRQRRRWDHLLSGGALKELAWLSADDGFAIFEAESKAAVMGMIQPFFPHFSQDIREIVAWENGKQAILASARQAASR